MGKEKHCGGRCGNCKFRSDKSGGAGVNHLRGEHCVKRIRKVKSNK